MHRISFWLTVWVTASLLLFNYFQRQDAPTVEMDEPAWIYSTYFYHLAFEKKDLQSSDWKSLDALDHPPLAKYMYGFFFRLANAPRITSLTLKNWWHANDDDFFHHWQFIQKNQERIPLVLLQVGRLLSTGFLFLCALTIYFILKDTFSPWVGFLTALLFSMHEVVRSVGGLIVADGLFLFFVLFAIRLQQLWMGALFKADKKSAFALSLSLGIVVGLAFLTKLNGMVALFTTVVVFIFPWITSEKKQIGITNWVPSLALMLIAFFATTWLLNPSLYSHPFQFLASMFEYRSTKVELQTKFFYKEALPNFFLKLSHFLSWIFYMKDWLYPKTGISVLLIFFILGILKIPVYLYRPFSSQKIVFLINALVWTVAVFYSFKLNWNRYLLPVLPFFLPVVAIGFEELVERFRSLARNRKAAIGSLTLFSVLFLGVGLFTRSFQLIDYREHHLKEDQLGHMQYWLVLSQLYPDRYDPIKVKEDLKPLEHELGDPLALEKNEALLSKLLSRLRNIESKIP